MVQGPRAGVGQSGSAGGKGSFEKLRLSSVSVRSDDHAARDAGCLVCAEVDADDVQAEIDASGDTSAGHHLSSVDKENITIDLHGGVSGRELVGVAPVCGGAATVENPAAASANAPVQTETTRAPRSAASRSARMICGAGGSCGS